ncbi:MAG TPA: helix-turn-helix domain-containing protein [Planctomycetota bacterium]
MRATAGDVWKRFSSLLFTAVGPDRYDLWTRHVRPAELDEENWLLHVESTYARDKIDTLFRAAAVDAAATATNRRVRLRFAVDPASFLRAPDDRLRDAEAGDAFSTFAIGPGNRSALAAARSFAAGRGALLALVAPSGLGKTHLLRAVERELRLRPGAVVLFFTAVQFRRHVAFSGLRARLDAFVAMCGGARAFLLDDLHLLCGFDAAQAAFVEVLDLLAAHGSRVALTAEAPPRRIAGLSPALRRRLRPDAEAFLDRPDVATSRAVLAANFPRLPAAALEVIAAEVRSSHKDQAQCAAKLLERGAPTPSAARAVAAEFLSHWSQGLTYADIARAVAESFGVAMTAIYADERSRTAADARQACFYLSRKLLGRPYAAIGDHFGGRDHATVLHACHKLEVARGDVRLERVERSLSR